MFSWLRRLNDEINKIDKIIKLEDETDVEQEKSEVVVTRNNKFYFDDLDLINKVYNHTKIENIMFRFNGWSLLQEEAFLYGNLCFTTELNGFRFVCSYIREDKWNNYKEYYNSSQYSVKIYLKDDFGEMLIYNSELEEKGEEKYFHRGKWNDDLLKTINNDLEEEVEIYKELLKEEQIRRLKEIDERNREIEAHFHNKYD